MLERCHNPNNPAYKRYGARGIFVCDEWLHNKNSFFSWALNNGYSDLLELDREKNDLGYSPANCRWVTRIINGRNTRANVYVLFQGNKYCVSELCAKYDINYNTVITRVSRGKYEEYFIYRLAMQSMINKLKEIQFLHLTSQ